MNNEAKHPMAALIDLLKADPDYAWGWFCNLSVPISDAIRVPPAKADQAAAFIMSQFFGVDITTHPHWNGSKSAAQEYFELRVAAEREEDERRSPEPTP